MVICSFFIYGNSGSGTFAGCRPLKRQQLELDARAEACMVTRELGGRKFLTVADAADVAEATVLVVVAAMGPSTAAHAVGAGAARRQNPDVAGAVAWTSHAMFEIAGGRHFPSNPNSHLRSLQTSTGGVC